MVLLRIAYLINKDTWPGGNIDPLKSQSPNQIQYRNQVNYRERGKSLEDRCQSNGNTLGILLL